MTEVTSIAPLLTGLHRLRLSVGRRLRRVDGGGGGRKITRSQHDIGLTRRHAGLTRLDGIDPGAGVVEARPDRRVNRCRPIGVDIG
jgi:hypothetical protein